MFFYIRHLKSIFLLFVFVMKNTEPVHSKHCVTTVDAGQDIGTKASGKRACCFM